MLRISIVFFASLMLAAGFQPAAASPKYASIVVDAHSGRVLQYYRDEQNRSPASLTKIMTVYVAFEEIRAGRMKPDTPIKISRHAAAQPASKLGFRPGETISARLALQALVVKSANDVATAMAEHISGSEAKFAKRMTRTARKLGMFDTNFVNASGLFNWRQKSSARDIARLAKAAIDDFPAFNPLWKQRYLVYNGRRISGHNRLLGSLKGSIGMKTGYIRAAGYNIVNLVERGDKRLIVVVMGGRSAKSRDAQVRRLLKTSLPRAAAAPTGMKRPRTAPAHAWLKIGSDSRLAKNIRPRKRPGQKPVAQIARASPLARPETPDPAEALVEKWKIQVGSFVALGDAERQLKQVNEILSGRLQMADARTETVQLKGKKMYRARFVNLSQAQAVTLCAQLTSMKTGCLPIAP
ncbi:MAG: D-alanyl-D-alanine carboxypeptidase DacD [Rhodobiaceae bacterium UBA7378]|nr:MAG: D-alanyl-D-alanine carboxypeptidase DacD [Rhodobiaceae bacterium UBA7378]